MSELSILPTDLRRIVASARAFDARIDAAAATDYFSDPAYLALTAALDRLSEGAGIEVLALAWLGRGDFDRSQWPEALTQAGQQGTRHLAEYLATIPLLGDYLEAGIAALGRQSADLALGQSDD